MKENVGGIQSILHSYGQASFGFLDVVHFNLEL